MPKPSNSTTRLAVLRIVTTIIFVILLGKLAQLQFVRGQNYQERATFNRVRIVRPAGERGVIYDRDGRMLARNKASFNVIMVPADLPDDPDYAKSQQKRHVVYEDVHELVETALSAYEDAQPVAEAEPTATPKPSPYVAGISQPPEPTLLSVEEMDELVLQREAGSAFQPIIVAANLPREVAMRIDEERYRLPGVGVTLTAERDYPSGSTTADLIGYMGPIPEEANQSYIDEGYAGDAWVGWTGLESSFEDVLRGIPGRRVIEVDVNGRERALLGEELPPEPGKNLILSIDLELQESMRKALEAGINPKTSASAVAIALDPRTGFVLGMVSFPTFDNNIFADGITEEEYDAILNARGDPLLNHAVSGIYPPGSTFKLVPASAGLEENVIAPDTLLNAPGIIYLPNRNFPDDPRLAQPFVCWIYKQGGYHGDLNVTQALAESCDIFFYKLGGGWYATEFEGLGQPALTEYSEMFGFGEVTGIDLPAEHQGLIPDAKWKRITKGERWVTGDTYNMSIGQGDVLATPLQVTQMTAAVANDGYLYRPQLVAGITDSASHLVESKQPELIRQLDISPRNLAITREGMWMAVNWEHGTAKIAALPDVQVAGKTGTAEFYDPELGRDGRGNLPTHAWFTAFAPYEDPEIVVTVFVYNGGEGSVVAAPIVRNILRTYFDIKARDAEAGSHSLLDQLQGNTETVPLEGTTEP
ncbi:MAG: penicillin-binding protein 2 [Caldilineales bacterium]|nr:penicillin-binding protein 2 [Caldilineales bacterium]